MYIGRRKREEKIIFATGRRRSSPSAPSRGSSLPPYPLIHPILRLRADDLQLSCNGRAFPPRGSGQGGANGGWPTILIYRQRVSGEDALQSIVRSARMQAGKQVGRQAGRAATTHLSPAALEIRSEALEKRVSLKGDD